MGGNLQVAPERYTPEVLDSQLEKQDLHENR